MISIMAVWMSTVLAAAPGAQITWLSVSPVSDKTEIVIRVDGEATYREPFMMDDGRLVVDINGVANASEISQAVNRGGIANVRVKQFQPNVARVVVELTKALQYTVSKDDNAIRIRFPNPAGLFEAWSATIPHPAPSAAASESSGDSPAATVATAPAMTKTAAPAPSTRTAARQTPAQQPTSMCGRIPSASQPMIVTYRDRPLSEVLGDFSQISGCTILPSKNASAVIVNAQILPPGLIWDVALQSILEANGLTQRRSDNGVIIVEDAAATLERSKQATLVTVPIGLKYVDADSVAKAIESTLTPGTGKVAVVTQTNSLLITDAQPVIDRVLSVIKEFDRQAPAVEIESKIAFVDRTTLEAMGVNYDLKDSRGNQLRGLADNAVDTNGNGVIDPNETTPDNVVLLGGNSIAALGNANVRVAGAALTLASSLVLGRHTLISFLEALGTVSLSDIQATPMIRANNNATANIQVGERTPIRVVDAQSAGGNGAPRANVRTENTGIILNVIPHITGDVVTMRMHAERSNIGAAPAGIDVTFQTQQAETVVTLRDGETVVIGGLTIIEKTKSRSGIPFLMDLPVIGKLFRNETNQENKRDLLIMVTPHIVRD